MRTPLITLLALVVSASCSRDGSRPPAAGGAAAQPGQPWNIQIARDPTPTGESSGQPQLTASPRGVIASWLEHRDGTATLRFRERTAGGWSEIRTAAAGRDWFVSWADVPAVMRMSDGTLVAQWLKNVDPLIEAYDLRLSYSRDEGKTWVPPFSPHHDGTRTQHGFASLFEIPGQGLGLVWLDGRQMALDTTSPDGGAMGLRYAAYDARWKQTAEAELDGRVCECCPTSAAVTADGVIAAFRDRSLREIRDISVSRLENGAWTPPTPVHVDNWEIDACPVNGPAVSAQGRAAAVAWFHAKDDRPRAYAAFSADAGRSWSAPVRVDDESSLGHVDIELLDDRSAAVSWMEYASGRSSFRLRRIDAGGGRTPAVEVASIGDRRVSGYPRLARAGNELVLAWTESGGEGGREQVRIALARLP